MAFTSTSTSFSDEQLAADIDYVKALPIVNTILQVVCETTGMRFAAVARVTSEKWIACSVKDDIQFGIAPGEELKLETTICNEIRQSGVAVVIDNVSEHPDFCDHHTPKMYGFQSYISIPIILQDGAFFGTLCAIDPAPALLNTSKVRNMFSLFSQLIAFHLEGLRMVEKSTLSLKQKNLELLESQEENRQYQYISNHNLQEPLRKMRMFSSMIRKASEEKNLEMVTDLAVKIDLNATRFSNMIKELSEFSELAQQDQTFSIVDLNAIVEKVQQRLASEPDTSHLQLSADHLLSITAIPMEMEMLVYHLVRQNLRHIQGPVHLMITTALFLPEKSSNIHFGNKTKYMELRIGDEGGSSDINTRRGLFDLFSNSTHVDMENLGNELAYCRKIVRRHGGTITASTSVRGSLNFSVILPMEHDQKVSAISHDAQPKITSAY